LLDFHADPGISWLSPDLNGFSLIVFLGVLGGLVVPAFALELLCALLFFSASPR
jgi:hypothetical protein